MGGLHRTIHSVKKSIRRIAPVTITSRQLKKRLVANFVEKHGLVYFGFVDQLGDEHKLVRGLTVSTSHRDDHYCIGSSGGYDLMFVERTDTDETSGAIRDHTWHIMTFDLHSSKDIPHLFIGAHKHDDSAFTRLFVGSTRLKKALTGTFGAHGEDFNKHFALYCAPSDTLDIERLLTPDVTQVIGAHFRSLSLEIVQGTLYVYADNRRLTADLLEAMLKNGLWLAKEIDARLSI